MRSVWTVFVPVNLGIGPVELVNGLIAGNVRSCPVHERAPDSAHSELAKTWAQLSPVHIIVQTDGPCTWVGRRRDTECRHGER